MSAGYRAVTALMLVSWLFLYIIIAWVIGAQIPIDSDFLELAYYPVAGLAWIPGAFWILKVRFKG